MPHVPSPLRRSSRNARRAAAGLALLLSPGVSAGAELRPERPLLPAYSLAGEDGPGSVWSNPANLGLDPDPGFLFLYGQEVGGQQNPELAMATNGGPASVALGYRTIAGGTGWWTLSSGLGLKVDDQLAIGVLAGWQLPDAGYDNRVTWDLAATWRPTHWLGVAGVLQNLGRVEPEIGLTRRYGPGVVLRPAGDRLLLGADLLMEDTAGAPRALVRGTLKAEPIEGLVLRASGDQSGEIGLGLEVFFGQTGGGAFAHAPADALDAPVASVWFTTTDRPRSITHGGDRVAHFELAESYPYQPAGGLLMARSGESYVHLLGRLRAAVDDPAVRGVVLELDRTPFSLAQVQELRAVLLGAKAADKPVLAYLHQASSNGAYMLAVAADEVYLHPAADLDIAGLAAELMYFAGTLDLIGVEAKFARRAEYKSGPEPLTRTGSSAAAREQLDALLDDLSEEWLTAIAEGRGREVEDIRRLVDEAPYRAARAEELGLVDGLIYPDELEEKLEATFSKDHTLEEEYRAEDMAEGWPARREIAVVYVAGTIVSGESSTPGFFGGGFTAGSDTIVRQLESARRNPAVKAVLLRVDSPGGSSFASDEIWRAVQRVQDRGKPVIVSMGGTAASGGYYVSAGADVILAEPTTITGSIGVYAGPVLDASELYERIGLNTELYTRGRNAAMFATGKPMDAHEFEALDRMVGATYDQFKQRVQDGRGMTAEQVEEVARGRVWSGKDALDVGLVDELGGFDDAVARARAEAGIPTRAPVRLITYSNRLGPSDTAVERGLHLAGRALGVKEAPLPPVPEELETLLRWGVLSEEKVLALMPYTLEVR